MSKPRSRTVRLTVASRFRIHRILGQMCTVTVDSFDSYAFASPAKLRAISKACLEMAGDE